MDSTQVPLTREPKPRAKPRPKAKVWIHPKMGEYRYHGPVYFEAEMAWCTVSDGAYMLQINHYYTRQVTHLYLPVADIDFIEIRKPRRVSETAQ